MVNGHILVTNRKEIYDVFQKRGVEHSCLLPGRLPLQEDMELIKQSGCSKYYFVLLLEDKSEHERISTAMAGNGMKGYVIDNFVQLPAYGIRGSERCNGVYQSGVFYEPPLTLSEMVDHMEIILRWLEGNASMSEWFVEEDRTDRCRNCNSIFEGNEAYCKYCGTKRGEGKFRPGDNPIVCVYGPPRIDPF